MMHQKDIRSRLHVYMIYLFASIDKTSFEHLAITLMAKFGIKSLKSVNCVKAMWIELESKCFSQCIHFASHYVVKYILSCHIQIGQSGVSCAEHTAVQMHELKRGRRPLHDSPNTLPYQCHGGPTLSKLIYEPCCFMNA